MSAEVNSWGGYEKQYQVRIDSERLVKHGLTFDDVIEALEKNNSNIGGGGIRQKQPDAARPRDWGGRRTRSRSATSSWPPKTASRSGYATSRTSEIGHEIRRGAVTAHGRGEAVLGLCFMPMGENSKVVTTG